VTILARFGCPPHTQPTWSLLIQVSPHVHAIQVVNDMPVTTTEDGILAELGSFYADETRKLLLLLEYVYRRPGAPCHVCGTEVSRGEMAGRNLFWCPTCRHDKGVM
jgi:formamidopyrimidine-DNA glycosylase